MSEQEKTIYKNSHMNAAGEMSIKPVAYIYTDFNEKFGIPRASTLVPELKGRLVLEPPYSDAAAVRGLEEYSHIWLLWGFSASEAERESLTAHPPRLGGKIKKGVFATRSPFRPNSIAMSVVKIENIIPDGKNGTEIMVSGVDMLNGTPVYDIKPYMPYTDSIPGACGGFGEDRKFDRIDVDFPAELLAVLPEDKRDSAVHILEQDPRAAYNKKPGYIFGLSFAGYDIRFTATDELITVVDVVPACSSGEDHVK